MTGSSLSTLTRRGAAARPPDASRDERRWTPGAWLTLAVALAYLAAGFASVLSAFRQPTEGWNVVNNEPLGWRLLLNQGGSSLLRVGDRVLAIDGMDVDSALLPRREAPPDWRVGGMARYTIERDGTVFDVDVPLVSTPPGEMFRFLFVGVDGTNASALICLVFGFVVFLLRPGNAAARLLLLILTNFMGAVAIWAATSTPAYTFFPPPLYWTISASGLLWPVMLAAIAHLALSFPRAIWPLTRWRRLTLVVLYGVTIAIWIGSLVTQSIDVYGPGLVTMMAVMALSIVWSIVYHLRAPLDPVARAQSAWVALGFGGTFLVAGASGLVGLIAPQLVSDWSGNLDFLILPICLGVAILRYRLFDIDVIVRRTLVYSALIASLGSAYVLAVVGLQALFVAVTGAENSLAVVASTLAIAALFRPVHSGIQRVIDRRFFRRAYDAARILDAFANRAQQDTDLDALSRDVVASVRDALEPESITLWLVPGRR